MKARSIATLLLVLIAAGCSSPHATVSTVDARPHLQFSNARSTAILILDGATIGPAAIYDGAGKTLVVERGTHQVEVRDGGRILFSGPVFLGGEESKTINLPD
jgi:hypothetical protein